MKKTDLGLPIATLNLAPGDILLVDDRSVDPKEFHRNASRTQSPIWMILAHPQPGMDLRETIRTCRLEDLKAVVAEMEAGIN